VLADERFQQQGLFSPLLLQPWIEDSFRNSAFLRRWLREHAGFYIPEPSRLAEDVGEAAASEAGDANHN
jgi:hypothetical protein